MPAKLLAWTPFYSQQAGWGEGEGGGEERGETIYGFIVLNCSKGQRTLTIYGISNEFITTFAINCKRYQSTNIFVTALRFF